MKKILPLFLTFLFFSYAKDDVDTMKLQSVYTEIYGVSETFSIIAD